MSEQADDHEAAHIGRQAQTPRRGDLDGVWRSRGYGWYWRIDGNRIDTFDEIGGRSMPTGTKARTEMRLRLAEGGRVLRVPSLDPAYHYEFERAGGLPERLDPARNTSPAATLDALAAIFDRGYAFFEARAVDWPRLVAEARGRINAAMPPHALFQVLAGLLAGIDDAHVELSARVGRRTLTHTSGPGRTLSALSAQARRQGVSDGAFFDRWDELFHERDVKSAILGGKWRQMAGGTILFGRMSTQVGYLTVRSMDNFAYGSLDAQKAAVDDAMEAALRLFEGARAVIIDLSINDGGYDALARHIAGRFAAAPALAYSKRAADWPQSRPVPIHVMPSAGRRFLGPVFVLTSNFSYSAAEIGVMCLRALPNVVHAGEPTRGTLSDALGKVLPNGWRVTLSNELYLDAAGMSWEGKGIPPALPMTVFSPEDVTKGHIEAVRALAALAVADR